MSVDETIRELSGTIAQLGLLVGKINEQIGGISSRVNVTLQTFDDSVSGIAKDANKMTEQVDQTIAQIPGSWAFYVLFSSLLLVLVLLSILILLSLVSKVQSICRLLRSDDSRASTPLQPLYPQQSESKPILVPVGHHSFHPGQQQTREMSAAEAARLRHIAVEMESEPRRYGVSPHSGPAGGFSERPMYHQAQTTVPEFHANGNGKAGVGSELRGRPYAASPRSQPGLSPVEWVTVEECQKPPKPVKRRTLQMRL